MPASTGPFHEGETQVQRRAGVTDEAARVGGMVGPRLPPYAQAFLAVQEAAVAATIDARGRPWASLLTGPPGFVRPVDDELLLVEPDAGSLVGVSRRLGERPELGLLVMDFASRRRLRLNGRAQLDGTRLFFALAEAYGNCPKYIRPRRVRPVPGGSAIARAADALDAGQRAWIQRADTLFVASYHPGRGADASHRGGPPGFVTVRGPRALSFPDFAGNNMFNTLGNLVVVPRAGLLFLDFERGKTLELTGRASLDWGDERADAPGRATVRFDVEAAIESEGGLLGTDLDAAPLAPTR
jgi:hypothetical protein